MKSIRLQLLVTLVATVLAAGFFVYRGLPPDWTIGWASEAGDLDLLSRCLSWGVDPEYRESADYWTPLRSAAFEGHTDAVRLLARWGANANAPHEEDGRTALHGTVTKPGGAAMVQALLEAGADLNARDDEGRPVLFSALSRGSLHEPQLEIIKLLIRHGIDCSVAWDEQPALSYAMSRKLPNEIILALLDGGANPDARDHNGSLPVELFLTRTGHTTESDECVVRKLIDCGADMTLGESLPEESFPESPAAFIVLARCREDTILAMIARLKDPDCREAEGQTLLHDVANSREKPLSIINALIDRGANVNAQDEDGQTPLFWAIDGSHTEGAALLLKRGVDVRIRDNKGRTPLQYAVKLKNHAIATLLRQLGARE